MKRQVIVTNWKTGEPPTHVYEDKGPGAATSRSEHSLDVHKTPSQQRIGESGGRVKNASGRG